MCAGIDRVALGRLIRVELAPAFTTRVPIVSAQGRAPRPIAQSSTLKNSTPRDAALHRAILGEHAGNHAVVDPGLRLSGTMPTGAARRRSVTTIEVRDLSLILVVHRSR
jgi:hypothetical protein